MAIRDGKEPSHRTECGIMSFSRTFALQEKRTGQVLKKTIEVRTR